jgi:NodT family efflux transporter outer membrane factor (OMF) lipoprotein
MKDKILHLLACLLLAACTVGKDYKKPDLQLNQNWQALDTAQSEFGAAAPLVSTASANMSSIILRQEQQDNLNSPLWWERFNDPVLTRLIEKTREANNDLKAAQARIAEARGDARATTSALYPQLNATGSATHNSAALGQPADTIKQTGLSASWDIDLFGGDQRNAEAAQAEIEATEADRNKVLLTIISNVATNYIQLRSLQQQSVLTIRNLHMQSDTLKITMGQRSAGAISDLEVARAEAEVTGTASRLPQIHSAMIAVLNRICVLTGESPHTLMTDITDPQPIPIVPKEVVIATPIDAIQRRPDVQASERRLAEATALSGAAIAQLYPKISLQSFFGGEWSQVYGYSAPFNATASALMPLLDWGRLHGLIDAANAHQRAAFFTYQQTVLQGIEEIENTLTSYHDEQKRQVLLEAMVSQQTKATEVAREQYKVGAATQLDLLTAENSQLSAENDLTLSRAALATDLVQLYIVMGESVPLDYLPGAKLEPASEQISNEIMEGPVLLRTPSLDPDTQ